MTDVPGDKQRDVLRRAMDAARQAEDDMTDAENVTSTHMTVCSEPGGKEFHVRIRTRPEPVMTAVCKHCDNPFWYKMSHGIRTHNGHYASWRVLCGWCAKPQYLPIDDDGTVVAEPVRSHPREEDL